MIHESMEETYVDGILFRHYFSIIGNFDPGEGDLILKLCLVQIDVVES